MPAGDDIGLTEKRVYADTRTETRLYVASDTGLARVRVSGDRVGRFDLALDGPIRDVAGRGGRLLIAAEEDVLVGTGAGFEATGFGPARAVGIDDDRLLAADDERIAVLTADGWEPIETVDGPLAIDGGLLAAGDGVYRVGDELDRLLDRPAVDVAAAGPYAACKAGLYDLRDGRRLREGSHTVVAAAEDRAHAVADGEALVRGLDGWTPVAIPADGPVVDVAYGEATIAVTQAGTVLVGADPGQTTDGRSDWRSRAIGLAGPRRLAVP